MPATSSPLVRYPRWVIRILLVAINSVCVVAMNVCAYSQYVRPQRLPSISYFGLAFPVFLLASVAFLLFWLVFHRRWALLSVAGMVLCAGSIRTYCPVNWPQTPPTGSIKVLSYNAFNFGPSPKTPWEENDILAYILQSGADIVCLQEAGAVRQQPVDSILATRYPYRLYTTYRQTTCACLSVLPIISVDTVHYASESNFSVACEIVVGADTMLLVNNHFESYKLHESDRDEYKELIDRPEEPQAREHLSALTAKLRQANVIRGAQVDSVAAYVQRSPHKYRLLCGDFNDASISYAHQRLTRLLNDAYTRSGNGPGVSYHRSRMYFRIDNILCSSNIIPYGGTVDSSIDSSDHYPIFCWLKFE